MSSAPYFKLYFSDLAGDTLALSDAEMGSYVLLIGAMWNAGGRLQNDPAKLARIARVQPKAWARRWASISQFFDVDDEHITHQRVFAERQKVASTSAERAAAGRASAEAKRLKTLELASTNVLDLNEQTDQQKPTILDTIATEEANASSSGKPATKPKSRKKPEVEIPDSFPDAEAMDDARSRVAADGKSVEVRTEAEKFRNHAAQTDRRARDWRAAWRNWIINALERAEPSKGAGRSSTLSMPRFPCDPIRSVVVAEKGEPWAVSYLDACAFAEVEGVKTIIAPNDFTAQTLRRDVPQLERRGAKIIVNHAPSTARSAA